MVVLRRSTKTGAAVFFGAMLMRSALASGTNGSLRAGIALWADGTAVALRADRPGITAHALQPDGACVALGPGVTAHALRTSRSHRPDRAPRSGGTRTALLAPNAARIHLALLAAKPLFFSRSLGTRGAGRPLDRDIAIRIGRAAAVPAAGPRVVIYRRLPLT